MKVTNLSAVATVRISNVSKSDEGVYHCHAINKVGRISVTTRLGKKCEIGYIGSININNIKHCWWQPCFDLSLIPRLL